MAAVLAETTAPPRAAREAVRSWKTVAQGPPAPRVAVRRQLVVRAPSIIENNGAVGATSGGGTLSENNGEGAAGAADACSGERATEHRKQRHRSGGSPAVGRAGAIGATGGCPPCDVERAPGKLSCGSGGRNIRREQTLDTAGGNPLSFFSLPDEVLGMELPPGGQRLDLLRASAGRLSLPETLQNQCWDMVVIHRPRPSYGRCPPGYGGSKAGCGTHARIGVASNACVQAPLL